VTDFPFKNSRVTAVSVVTPGQTHLHVYAIIGFLSLIYSYDSDISDNRDNAVSVRELSVTPPLRGV
jgi:hypothetical protein